MRTAFVETLLKLAEEDERVWLVTGDLGYSVFEEFRDRFPKQYLNVGVAEQNMVGVAAGLALSGKRPFVYSISTFVSMRAYEQVRNDVCYQNLPVVLIGGGSTFSYSSFGCTHMPLEDFAIMRALPNMAVLSPGDPMEVRELLRAAHERGGPTYMRIAKKGEPVVEKVAGDTRLGTMSLVCEGSDATIIVTGRQLPNAVAAAKSLANEGVSVRVLSAHTLKPFDSVSLLAAVRETGAIVTCEEHSAVGGLSSAVADVLVREGAAGVSLVSLSVADEFPKGVGSQNYFLDRYGLSEHGLINAVKRARGNA